MELSDLTGVHELSGVELGSKVVHNDWEEDQECQFVKFTLDGTHYMAVEDPDDGYRSRCRELVVSDEPPKFSFPSQKMICHMMCYSNDVLVMVDAVTGETILEVGTKDFDDYYPCCHFVYNPEGMACNTTEISDDAFNRIIGN